MLYDYIIIGAGISGLYSAYNIKKKDPTKKILILEKNKIIGGRMNVYNFYGTNVNIGAGVGRKKKDYLLIKLLDELKIKYEANKKKIYYHENVSKINFNNIVKKLRNSYNKDIHNNYIFKKFGIEILGNEEYKKFVTYLGYSDFENTDAYETLYFYDLDDDISGGETLHIKWDELLNALSIKIGMNNIKFNNNIISINKVDNEYIITNSKKIIYSSKKIIIASTIDTVKKLLRSLTESNAELIPLKYGVERYISSKLSIYNDIKGQNFLRVYGKFDENSTNIINSIIKGYTVVNDPIKKIIPINKKNGIYMIVYTDNKSAKYFINNLDDKIFFCKEIEKMLNLSNLKLIGLKSFYWNIGTHYYKPLNNKYKNREEFIIKCQNPEKNLFVVGELISRNQGWTQGALESVNNIINFF